MKSPAQYWIALRGARRPRALYGLFVGVAGLLLTACTSKLESDFIAGCRSAGGGSSYCSCTYEKMEAPFKAAEKYPNLMLSVEFKRAYESAVNACKS